MAPSDERAGAASAQVCPESWDAKAPTAFGTPGHFGYAGAMRRRYRGSGARLGAALVGAALTTAIGSSGSGCLVLHEQDEAPHEAANECVVCHGNPARVGTPEAQAAPPNDVAGQSDFHAPGVGAHANHVEQAANHTPVACSECHLVPSSTWSPGHIDSALPAEVVPGPLALLGDHPASYDPTTGTCSATYCHGLATPHWTAPLSWACGSCHALPPPQCNTTNEQCSDCHGEVLTAGRVFLRRDLHVNGTVDVATPDAGR